MRAYSKRRGTIVEVGVVPRTGPIRPHEARLIEAVEEWARIESFERGRLPETSIVVHFDGGVDVEVTPRTRPDAEQEEDASAIRFRNMEIT